MSLSILVVLVIKRFNKYLDLSKQYETVTRSALSFQEASDYLTEEARLFIISSDLIHLKNYFNEKQNSQRREKAVETIKECVSNQNTVNYFESALYESLNLENQEYYSMKLVVLGKHLENNQEFPIPSEVMQIQLSDEDSALNDEYKIAKAWLMMFSYDYLQHKQYIFDRKSKSINEFLSFSDLVKTESCEALKNEFTNMIICIGCIFLLNLLLFIFIAYLIIKPLYLNINNISKKLRLSNFTVMELDILSKTYNEMFDKNEATQHLLRHKAEHDELTDLLNRNAFNQIKCAFLNTKESIALILIDIDFFKKINDTFGHTVGDQVLQKFSVILKENFRTSDYVSRIGGDEFAIIMTNCDFDFNITSELISTKLRNIQNELDKKFSNLSSVSISCGIEISNNGYYDKLFEQADAALYLVKRTGRKNFKFYTDDMDNLFN